jgi:hypothetical protein
MPAKQAKLIVAAVTLIVIATWIGLSTKNHSTSILTEATATPELIVAQPSALSIPNGPLKQSMLSAGDYLIRHWSRNRKNLAAPVCIPTASVSLGEVR